MPTGHTTVCPKGRARGDLKRRKGRIASIAPTGRSTLRRQQGGLVPRWCGACQRAEAAQRHGGPHDEPPFSRTGKVRCPGGEPRSSAILAALMPFRGSAGPGTPKALGRVV